MNLLLRMAVAADAEELAAIEQQAFPDPSWTAPDFLRYECIVAVVDRVLAGFLVARETFGGSADALPEREILNVAVGLEFRRQGIAKSLLAAEIKPSTVFFLEVRESNFAARQLYKKMGFTEASIRPDYYANPSESAIVMCLK